MTLRPFFSDKYDITRHRNYPLLLDDNPKNEFDIAKFVQKKKERRLSMNPETEFTQIECHANNAEESA